MSLKIGLIGGLGWPATTAYYEAICKAQAPGTGTPEMTIESLDMSRTLAARGKRGDEESWQGFDRMFHAALARLDATGCDVAAIASVTPHTRLASIAASSPLPIVSIVDAVSQKLEPGASRHAAILGTSVTMEGSLFDRALAQKGIAVLRPDQKDIAAFTALLEAHFYTGQAVAGRAALMDYVQSVFGPREDLVCILACTDLAHAFPEAAGQADFSADNVRFFDATSAHVAAILEAASR